MTFGAPWSLPCGFPRPLCLAFGAPTKASVCIMVLKTCRWIFLNFSAPWKMLYSCTGRLCRYLRLMSGVIQLPWPHHNSITERCLRSTAQISLVKTYNPSLCAPYSGFCIFSLLHHNNVCPSAKSVLRLHCLLTTTTPVRQMNQKAIRRSYVHRKK